MTTSLGIQRIFVLIVSAAALTAWTRSGAPTRNQSQDQSQDQAHVAPAPNAAAPHVIEFTADSDSRYKMAGVKVPEIVVKAGEPVLLRVTAKRAKTWNRDGSIHGFTLLHDKDRSRVDGWDLLFKPGKQEFLLTAPTEPGLYVVVCSVICSDEHEGMHMKFTVVP